MKKHFIFVILLACMFVSCGQTYRAERVAKQFLKENLKDEAAYAKTFGRVDSTFRIADSLVVSMHREATTLPELHGNITYGKATKPLKYIPVKLSGSKDTVTLTLYLDKELRNVVAVKRDWQ